MRTVMRKQVIQAAALLTFSMILQVAGYDLPGALRAPVKTEETVRCFFMPVG